MQTTALFNISTYFLTSISGSALSPAKVLSLAAAAGAPPAGNPKVNCASASAISICNTESRKCIYGQFLTAVVTTWFVLKVSLDLSCNADVRTGLLVAWFKSEGRQPVVAPALAVSLASFISYTTPPATFSRTRTSSFRTRNAVSAAADLGAGTWLPMQCWGVLYPLTCTDSSLFPLL